MTATKRNSFPRVYTPEEQLSVAKHHEVVLHDPRGKHARGLKELVLGFGVVVDARLGA